MAFTKNIAVTGFSFGLINKSTGAAVTSGTVTGYVTLDGGTQAALGGSPVHEGNGQWSVNLTAAEMNGDIVGLLFTHTDAVNAQFTIRTTTASSASQASTPGAVSGVTLYAAESDVEFIWSEFGVTTRLDDDQNGVADDDLMELGLQAASLEVNRYLLRRYTVAVIAASAWARWATAYIAAVKIGKRRGNPIPDSLAEETQVYIDELKLIRDNRAHLNANDGLATPRHDMRPSVTNFGIDPRYGRTKIRRIERTSTGPNQADGLKRNDEAYPYLY